MENLIKLTGLWKGKDKKGNGYLSGNLNAVTRLMILKNDFKKDGGKDPDYILYIGPKEKVGDGKEKPKQKDGFDF